MIKEKDSDKQMNNIGLSSSAKFRKSAAVTGDVLAKYHPHGDVAVYESMVRMSQDFNMRYPLINGQGNWGSIDGDSAAAMRYTECKLSKIGDLMLQDIEKNTVNFIDNYDGTRQEPVVLPSPVPQLLLNGSLGIAVGMATNIPPHNLTEVLDATIHLLDHPKAETQDLFEFIQGPDFPTGGTIYDRKEIIAAYSQGKGAIIMQGKAEISEKKDGSDQIVITEIPYQVLKSTLVEQMADLVSDKKIEGIRDIRDLSDREGMRIVIDIKKGYEPQRILNRLYKFTSLQKTFHLNLLALVDGIQPEILSLVDVLKYFIEHRKQVTTRRVQFDLDKAKERAHILEGLMIALKNIDAVINTIKKSATKEIAHENLKKKFKLSDKQSTAILEMRLQTLAGLERKKIEDELKEKKKLIAELEDLLKSPKKILGVIKKELQEIKEKFGDERKTRIVKSAVGEFKQEDLIPNEETIIVLTEDDYVKRMPPSLYRVQKRGGKGVIGITTREEDLVKHLACVNSHDNLLFFTTGGRVFQTKAYEIPEASRVARGQAIVNFLELAPKEEVSALVALKENLKNKKKGEGAKSANDEENFLVMMTKNGIIKKTAMEDFSNVRRSGLIAMKLDKDDQ